MSSAIFRASYNREVHKNYSILLVNYEFTFLKSQGKKASKQLNLENSSLHIP